MKRGFSSPDLMIAMEMVNVRRHLSKRTADSSSNLRLPMDRSAKSSVSDSRP